MNWIYELTINLLGVSRDWAMLIVQLSLVIVVITLLHFFPRPVITHLKSRSPKEISVEDRVGRKTENKEGDSNALAG